MTHSQAPRSDRLPNALEAFERIQGEIGGRQEVFFLDLDGTLAPIVDRPDLVELPAAARRVLHRLAERRVVCLVSGRGLDDLRDRVGLDTVFYAADHGHRILGPPGSGVALEVGGEHQDRLRAAAAALETELGETPGVIIESKGLSLSIHYRLVPPDLIASVGDAAAQVAESFSDLLLTQGKMVYELRPPGGWDKGRATLWLLERLAMDRRGSCPLCIGDDLTDEDMFSAVAGWGIGIIVGPPDRETRARYHVEDPAEAVSFLARFAPED